MDRAYLVFAWFHKLTQRKTFFVILLKKGVQYTVRERRAVQKSKGITSDQIIGMTGPKGSQYHKNLCRVGYKDPETGQHYVYLTNIFDLSAKTIADIYRERWQVELFFKWIKQNLKIKRFLGTSKNAVMTQIWIALITLLLLYYYKFIIRYLDKSKIFDNLLLIKFGGLRKNKRGTSVYCILKQLLCFFMDRTSRHLTYFDHLKEDKGYAGAIEVEPKDMASSHAVKRFIKAFSWPVIWSCRGILQNLFYVIWQARGQWPPVSQPGMVPAWGQYRLDIS